MFISQNLHYYRKKSKFTFVQVAQSLNLKYQQYQKYEYGINIPSIDILCRIADLYCISLDELVRVPHGTCQRNQNNEVNE